MAITLFIENESADLAVDTVIALTFQVNDLTNLESREGNYSNEFTLPLTAKNKRLLGFAHIPASNTRLPYTKINATLMLNGLQSLPGYLVLESTTDETANCTFYSGNSDFFEAMGSATLNDLDLSAHNHFWGLTGTNNVFTNKTNTGTFNYPIIEWGKDKHTLLSIDNRIINPKYLRPAIFTTAILEAIEAYTGYDIKSVTLQKKPITYEAIPITNTILKHSAYWNQNQVFTATKNTDQTIDAGETEIITFPNIINDPGNNFSNSKYNVPATGKYSFMCSFMLFGIDFTTNTGPTIRIRRKNADGVITTLASKYITEIPTVFSSYIVADDIALNAGDEVYVEVHAGSIIATIDTGINSASFYCNAVEETEIEYNQEFEFTGNMPDISLKDFVKALCVRYNFLTYTNSAEKTIEFISFREYYSTTANCLDWTRKMDINNAGINFQQDGYARRTIFDYLIDNKEVTEGAKGIMDIGNEIAEKEETVYKQPFAATPNIKRLLGIEIPQIKLYEIEDNKLQAGDVSPRILYVIQNTLLIQADLPDEQIVKYNDGVTELADENTTDPFAWYISQGKPENLGFENNLLPFAYTELTEVLKNYKKLTAWFNLTANDVINFDFKRPIYLQQFSAYFYVNKIENYTPQKLTKVELIKL
jgi:hypothetical protein